MQPLIKIEVRFEKGVKTDVRAKPRPVVSVGKMDVVPVYNVNFPAHQAHLQP